MVRTQVYLTEEEKIAIIQFSDSTGKSQSQIIRLAIDSFIKTHSLKGESAFGIWKDNKADFLNIRKELDRRG